MHRNCKRHLANSFCKLICHRSLLLHIIYFYKKSFIEDINNCVVQLAAGIVKNKRNRNIEILLSFYFSNCLYLVRTSEVRITSLTLLTLISNLPAHQIAKDMERWAKKLNNQSETKKAAVKQAQDELRALELKEEELRKKIQLEKSITSNLEVIASNKVPPLT